MTGSGEIKKQLKDVRSVIAKVSGAQADEFREHGDKINFGKFQLECRSTPGHTNGEYSVTDPEFSSGGSKISTGWGRQRGEGGGRQHTILPNFVKNCMKLKEFGSGRGGRVQNFAM